MNLDLQFCTSNMMPTRPKDELVDGNGVPLLSTMNVSSQAFAGLHASSSSDG
jgi:hypothetical protein